MRASGPPFRTTSSALTNLGDGVTIEQVLKDGSDILKLLLPPPTSQPDTLQMEDTAISTDSNMEDTAISTDSNMEEDDYITSPGKLLCSDAAAYFQLTYIITH